MSTWLIRKDSDEGNPEELMYGLSPLSLWLYSVVITFLGIIFSIHGSMYVLGFAVSVVLSCALLVCPIYYAGILLLLMLVGWDVSQVSKNLLSMGIQQVGSPWKIHIGPFTPGLIQMGLYVVVILRLRSHVLLSNFKCFIYYAVAIGLIGMIIHLLSFDSLQVPWSTVFSDARTIIFFTVSLVLWHSFLSKFPDRSYAVIQIIFLVFFVRAGLDFLFWMAEYGPTISGFHRASVDSTKWTVIVIFFWGLYNLFHKKQLLLSGLSVVISLTLVGIFMTRLNFITLAFGLIVFLFAVRKARLVFLGLPVLCLILVASLFVLREVNPDMEGVIANRILRLEALKTLDIYEVDSTRYTEFVNIAVQMVRDGTIITGRGFGGFYTDDTMSMGTDLVSAFPYWCEVSGRFPKVHNLVGHFILKLGLIGVVLWIGLWIRYFILLSRRSFFDFKRERVRVVLLSFMPTLLASGYWSSKGVVLTGLFFAISHHMVTYLPKSFSKGICPPHFNSSVK